MKAAIFALLLAFAGLASAIEPIDYRDAAEEARFRALTAELRCVMCQNQSLADSNAQIAEDLRRQVLDQMREGKSDDEIGEVLGTSALRVTQHLDDIFGKLGVNDRTRAVTLAMERGLL